MFDDGAEIGVKEWRVLSVCEFHHARRMLDAEDEAGTDMDAHAETRRGRHDYTG